MVIRYKKYLWKNKQLFFVRLIDIGNVYDSENEEMSQDVIEKIIGAALKAPTNDHMRDWHYIVIQDKNNINCCYSAFKTENQYSSAW